MFGLQQEHDLSRVASSLESIANSLKTLVNLELEKYHGDEFNANPTFEEQCEMNGVRPGVDFPWT